MTSFLDSPGADLPAVDAKPTHRILAAFLLISALSTAHVLVRPQVDPGSLYEQDVYFAWLEGNRILHGVNPYERVLAGNMRRNDKYATYLPGFYLLASAIQLSGTRDYPSWLNVWRLLFEAFYLATGALLFAAMYTNRRSMALAFTGLAYWLFGRWSLDVAAMAHIEPVAIFFLIVAWVLLPARPIAAMFSFGVSLSIKHLGIVVAPLLLIVVWNQVRRAGRPDALSRLAVASAAIAAVPVGLSLPFIIWNPEAFGLSLVFSITRDAETHFNVAAVDTILGLNGVPARMPMLLLLSLTYLSAWQQRMDRDVAALLAISIFLSFNPVLFTQYMMWASPFLLLAAARRGGETAGIRMAKVSRNGPGAG